MKLDVELKDLRSALALVKPAVAGKGYRLPILAGVRLTASDDRLEVTATDLDLTIQTTICARVVEPGTILVNHKLLADAAKGKGSLTIAAEDGDDMVQVVNGARRGLRTMPLEEYPKLPTLDPDCVKRGLGIAQLAQVAAAASKDTVRPMLCGVLFTGTELVATDSYRLHIEPVYSEELAKPVLIPAGAIAAVTKAVKSEGVVLHFTDEHSVAFTGQTAYCRTTWTTRLIESEFPNYKALIPKGYPNVVTFDQARFLELVGEAKAFAPDNFTPIRLAFEAPGMVKLTVVSPDRGDFEASLAFTGDEPQCNKVAFDPRYLYDCAATLDGPEVSLSFIDGLKPAIVGSPSQPGGMRLLMPVRTP